MLELPTRSAGAAGSDDGAPRRGLARRARWHERLRAFLPAQERTTWSDVARLSLGTLAAMLVVATVTRAWLGSPDGLPWLVAPIGASAVLVFALPASPLSQPWPTVGGLVVSALAGVAAAKLLGHGAVGGAVAVTLALAAMSGLRCLHPPGGAVALMAVLGGSSVTDAGWGFAVLPVGVDVVLLVVLGLLVNNAFGHSYPHVAAAPAAPELPSADPPLTEADVADALAAYGDRLDVTPQDVLALVNAARERAWWRLTPENLR